MTMLSAENLNVTLAGRPVLYEEFGVNTQWPDAPSRWSDEPTWNGGIRRTYFAGEDEAAEYCAGVLPRPGLRFRPRWQRSTATSRWAT